MRFHMQNDTYVCMDPSQLTGDTTVNRSNLYSCKIRSHTHSYGCFNNERNRSPYTAADIKINRKKHHTTQSVEWKTEGGSEVSEREK